MGIGHRKEISNLFTVANSHYQLLEHRFKTLKVTMATSLKILLANTQLVSDPESECLHFPVYTELVISEYPQYLIVSPPLTHLCIDLVVCNFLFCPCSMSKSFSSLPFPFP